MTYLQFSFKGFDDYKLIRSKVNHFLKDLLHDRSIFIQIAINEAVNNAILHGNKNCPNKQVQIALKTKDDQLIIKIKDSGNGFEGNKKVDFLEKNYEKHGILKESGRGLLIIRQVVDELKYNEKGNEMILVVNMDQSREGLLKEINYLNKEGENVNHVKESQFRKKTDADLYAFSFA